MHCDGPVQQQQQQQQPSKKARQGGRKFQGKPNARGRSLSWTRLSCFPSDQTLTTHNQPAASRLLTMEKKQLSAPVNTAIAGEPAATTAAAATDAVAEAAVGETRRLAAQEDSDAVREAYLALLHAVYLGSNVISKYIQEQPLARKDIALRLAGTGEAHTAATLRALPGPQPGDQKDAKALGLSQKDTAGTADLGRPTMARDNSSQPTKELVYSIYPIWWGHEEHQPSHKSRRRLHGYRKSTGTTTSAGQAADDLSDETPCQDKAVPFQILTDPSVRSSSRDRQAPAQPVVVVSGFSCPKRMIDECTQTYASAGIEAEASPSLRGSGAQPPAVGLLKPGSGLLKSGSGLLKSGSEPLESTSRRRSVDGASDTGDAKEPSAPGQDRATSSAWTSTWISHEDRAGPSQASVADTRVQPKQRGRSDRKRVERAGQQASSRARLDHVPPSSEAVQSTAGRARLKELLDVSVLADLGAIEMTMNKRIIDIATEFLESEVIGMLEVIDGDGVAPGDCRGRFGSFRDELALEYIDVIPAAYARRRQHRVIPKNRDQQGSVYAAGLHDAAACAGKRCDEVPSCTELSWKGAGQRALTTDGSEWGLGGFLGWRRVPGYQIHASKDCGEGVGWLDGVAVDTESHRRCRRAVGATSNGSTEASLGSPGRTSLFRGPARSG
ncbi:uncharacterized protein BJ171DRAFT_568463 [Polychytrium aggregatum]|uniref:uncharacterized protein n=1 Tax=Polychytrium aggregatum TaxID=110093 RepID=UPI0022FEB80E|nr:uncharacterized protein BJ171DRAFT_568463 [Polychytrium aggregatum]KAI9203988.1 hypothetical protein BJ171DRAFT_568463 [Polychytrium aggregatum]